MTERAVLDSFAGPGGWSEGLRSLGYSDFGIEWDATACETRYAAGHTTWKADVEQVDPSIFDDLGVWGFIASPPCPDWSQAGRGAGMDGASGRLIWEPMRFISRLSPAWVAMEQVPPALPVWKQYRYELAEMGYGTWCGILNAADYGVPQTRERAILMAVLDGVAVPPEPTHSPTGAEAGMFGAACKPWITMAEALGWGLTQEPAGTMCANSGRQGGSSPLDGGSGARERYYQAMRTPGHWAWKRPATTVCCDSRIFSPDYRGGRRAYELGEENDPSQRAGTDSIAVTTTEALVLQGFRSDYPVQGATEKAKHQQIGNAIPPPLAAAICGELISAALEVA